MRISAGHISQQAFGHYEIANRLAVGGMAETFVAVRRGPGGFSQRVCLKRILPAHCMSERFVQLFLDEAKLAAQLRHGNIVQVYDFGVVDDVYYMALELVEGLDLRSLMEGLAKRGERLHAPLVAFVATELATALDYAHNVMIDGRPARLVHRDVSPSNVLISSSGEIKLADFGIAKAASQAHVTASGAVVGKLPYMAPEHLGGEQVDARTDLFALGVVLFELLAMRRPFDGASDMQTISNIMQGERPSLMELAPQASPNLCAIVERLIEHDPADRYTSAAELLEALAIVSPGPLAQRQVASIVRPLTHVELYDTADISTLQLSPEPIEQGKTSSVHTLSAVERRGGESERPRSERPRSARPPANQRVSVRPRRMSGMNERVTRTLPVEMQDAGTAPLPLAAGGRQSLPRGAVVALLCVGSALTALLLQASLGAKTTPHEAAQLPLHQAAALAPLAAPPTTHAPEPPPVRKASVTGQTVAPAANGPSQAPVPVDDADVKAGSAARVATLRVFAIPYGGVWIDGRYVGDAPLRTSLTPGRHNVEVGTDTARKAQRIVVRGGEHKRVVVDLQRR